MNSDYYHPHSQMEGGDQPHGMQQPQRYSSGGNRGGNYQRQAPGQGTGNLPRHQHPAHPPVQQQQSAQNQATHQPGSNVGVRPHVTPNLQQAPGYMFQTQPVQFILPNHPTPMVRYQYTPYPQGQYPQGQQFSVAQQQQHQQLYAQQQINAAYAAAAYSGGNYIYQTQAQQPQNHMHHTPQPYYPNPSHNQTAMVYARAGVPAPMPVQQVQPSTQQPHAAHSVAVQAHQPQLAAAQPPSVLMQPAVLPGTLVTHTTAMQPQEPRELPVPKPRRILNIIDPSTGEKVIKSDAHTGYERAPSASPQPAVEIVGLPEDGVGHGVEHSHHDHGADVQYDGMPVVVRQNHPIQDEQHPVPVVSIDGEGKNKAKSDFFQKITAAADEPSGRSHSTPDVHPVTGPGAQTQAVSHPPSSLPKQSSPVALGTVAFEPQVAASAPPAFTHPQVPVPIISLKESNMVEPETQDTSMTTSLPPSQLPKEHPIDVESQPSVDPVPVPKLEAETETSVPSDAERMTSVLQKTEETLFVPVTTEEEMNNAEVPSTPQSGGRGDQFLDLSMASISPEPIEKYIDVTPEKIPEVADSQDTEFEEPSLANDVETESVPVPEVPVVKTEEIRPPPTSELKNEDEITRVEKGLEELKITAVETAQNEPIFTNGGNEIDDEGMEEEDEEGELHEGDGVESDESGEQTKKRIVYDRDTLINYKTGASKDLVQGISDSIPPELIRDGNSPFNVGPPPRSQTGNYGVGGGGYGRQNSAQGGRMGNNNAGPFPNRMRGMAGQGPGGWDPMRGPFQIPPQPPGPNRPPVSIQLRPVTLHKAKDAWKPGRNIDETKDKEQILIEDMKKKTRGILNKLTPENFDKLLQKFLMLKFEEEIKDPEKRSDTEKEDAEGVIAGRIGAVISVVFEKAIDEPSFSTAYAKMVHRVHSEASVITSKIFRKKILDQCQKEFQQGNYIEEDVKLLEEKLLEAEEDKKALIKLEIEDKKFTARRRSLGNVRFIGELYKLAMLTPKIMIECVHMLISNGDEESLECLCKLLTTVGQRLEENLTHMVDTMKIKKPQPGKWGPDPNFMNVTFSKLHALSNDKSLSSRIRFALLDVCELRTSGWKPRRDANAPKTIEEVRRAAAREEQEEKKQLMNLPQPSAPSRGGPMSGPPIQKKGEWTNVETKKSSRFAAATKKTGGDSSGDLPKLAPGGVPWGSSARGGGSGYPQRGAVPPRFSNAFREPADGPPPVPSREDIVQQLPQARTPSSQSSRESSRPHTPTRENNTGSPRVAPLSTTKKSPPPEQSQDFDPKEAVKQIFKEFLSVKKVDYEWIEKRFPGERRMRFVEELCRQVMDMSHEDQQKAAGVLVKNLIKTERITKAQVILSLKDNILPELPEIEVDSPRASSYFAMFLLEVFGDEEDLSWLLKSGESIEEDYADTWGNLVTSVLSTLKLRRSEAVVQGLYKKTRGANRLPTEDSQWVHGESVESIVEKLSKVLRSMSDEESLTSVLQENSCDFRETDVIKGVTESICAVCWAEGNGTLNPVRVKRFFSQLPKLQSTKHFPIIWNQVQDFMKRQDVDADQKQEIWAILSALEIVPMEKAK